MSASTKERKAWRIANKQAMVDFMGGQCVLCGQDDIDKLIIIDVRGRHYDRSPYNLTYVPEYGQSWTTTYNFMTSIRAGIVCNKCYETYQEMWEKEMIGH